MENIERHLGYRLTLTSTDFNEKVKPGGILNLTVHLQNTGFASILNERPVYVVLVGEDGIPPYEVKLDIDPRRWEFGNSSFNVKLHIPSNLTEGQYRLALWLPDAYETLRDNPLYAIRFADDDMWDEATGYNYFGSIQVDKTASGSYQRGKEFEVIESTVLTEGVVPSVPLAVTATADSSPTPSIIQTATSQVAPTLLPLQDLSLPVHNPKVTYNGSDITIQFEYLGEMKEYNAFQVFIDMDSPDASGYMIQGMDADLLLENNALNRYSGQNQDWAWEQIGPDLMYANENHIVSWTITDWNEQALPPMRLVFQLVDTNWNAFFTSEPISVLQLLQ